MSGIIGSRLNIRGSGVVGGLGTDGQVLTSAGAGQEIVFESLSSAAITAINNPTANELVTVGSTTTELDAESGLTYTDGALVIGGTTPSLTIGDAGAEDTKIVFDGNAQDFHIGLDDTADDLVIGLGSALGTTPAIAIDENLKVNIPVTTASTSTSTGSLTTGGGMGVGADLYVGDDAYLITDSAVLGFGADKDTTLTHTDGTGLTLNSTNKLTFGDAASYIQQSSDGVLKINGEATVDINATAAVTIAAEQVPVNVGGIPFYADTTNYSMYTHDVSGTDSTAQYNLAYGLTALDAITTGDHNLCIGYGAGGAMDTGAGNIAIGHYAGDGFDAETFNMAIGFDALGGAVAGGEYNIAIGHYVLDGVTSGDNNTVVGYASGGSVTTGDDNVFIGYRAGDVVSTASDLIAIGANALGASDTEGLNIAIGKDSMLVANSGAEYNVCLGANTALRLTSSDKNTFVGYASGQNITTAEHSCFVGYATGEGCTGAGNILIGYRSHNSDGETNGAIGIGNNVSVPANDFGFGDASNLVSNDYDADANWSYSSDARMKRNVQDDTLGLDFINDLRTVTYQWRPSNEIPEELTSEYNEENQRNLDAIMHGFIAQEVKVALDTAGVDTFAGWKLDERDGETQRTSREMFVMPLIRAVQELSAKVTALENA